MTASNGDEEAFVGQAEGELGEDVQVLADLDGQALEGQRWPPRRACLLPPPRFLALMGSLA